MEAKHTTGPWVIDWNVSRLDIFGADETTLVASLRRSPLSQAIDEAARSNARLIAAAPELYDALRELLTDMVIAQGNMRKAAKRDPAWEGCAEIIQPRVDAARAAIAKAEGK